VISNLNGVPKLKLVKICVVEKSVEISWDLYQMTRKAQSTCKFLTKLPLGALMMVLIQSFGDDLLSEGKLQETFLCSWSITQ
jgi:hypothetical protein